MRRAAVTVGALLATLAVAAPAHARTVWLCKPGLRHNPCTPSLTTTRFTPAGAKVRVLHVRRARHPKVDCFYVYPTVSNHLRRFDHGRGVILIGHSQGTRSCCGS